jgi:lysophospholipase L1-like esterase
LAEGRERTLIAAQIDRFNSANRQATTAAGARYVDITPLSRRVAGDPTWLAGDGLHPAGKMYAAWVDVILPVALQALGLKARG